MKLPYNRLKFFLVSGMLIGIAAAVLIALVFLTSNRILRLSLSPTPYVMSIYNEPSHSADEQVLTFECCKPLDRFWFHVMHQLIVKSRVQISFSYILDPEKGLYCAYDNNNLGIVFLAEPSNKDFYLSGRGGIRNQDQSYWNGKYLDLIDGETSLPYFALPELSSKVVVE